MVSRRPVLWALFKPAIAAAAAASILEFLAQPVRDPDVFWHLKAGQWILEHRAIPRTDPFSWTVAGRPWTAHEWASELLYAAGLQVGGPWLLVALGVALVMAALVCAAVPAGLAVPGESEKPEGPWYRPLGEATTWAVLLVTAVGLMPGLHLRPQLFSYFFFGLTLALLARRAYLWLIPLGALWANLHGMFVLLPGLLGLHGLVELWDRRSLRTWPFRTWAAAMAGALTAPLLTPHGPALYRYVWETLTDSQMQVHILEWQSPDFHSFGLPFGIALIGTVVISRAAGVRWSTWEAALWAVFGLFALISARNIPLFFLAMVPLWHRVGKALLAQFPAFRSGAARSAAGAVAVLLLVAALPRSLEPPLATSGPQAGQPEAAVAYLLAHPEIERVFNHYNFGGYLIWRGVPVAVDGRADLYVPDVMQAVLDLDRPERWQAVLERYRPDAVLWYAGSPLSGYLAGQPAHWERVVESDGAVLFIRRAD